MNEGSTFQEPHLYRSTELLRTYKTRWRRQQAPSQKQLRKCVSLQLHRIGARFCPVGAERRCQAFAEARRGSPGAFGRGV